MQINTLLKVNIKNPDFSCFLYDNDSTFLVFSDLKEENNGFWFNGFKLFKSIFPENKNNSVENKTITSDDIGLTFAKKANLNFFLFKNGDGLLVELKSNKFIPYPENNYNLIFNIDTDFQILEKNIRNIIIQYEIDNREKPDSDKIFLSINLSMNYNFENVVQNGKELFLSIMSIEKTAGEPSIYLLYSHDYSEVKRKSEANSNKVASYKKDIIDKSNNIFEHLKFNSDDKELNKFIQYSFVQSNNLIRNINDKITGLVDRLPNPSFTNGINTLLSISGLFLISGRYEAARNVLLSFLNYQNNIKSSSDYGRMPDEIYSNEKIEYNSPKTTPLFIISLYEYFSYTSDYDLIEDSMDMTIKAIDKQLSTEYINTKNDDVKLLWFTALICVERITKYIDKRNKVEKESKSKKELTKFLEKVEGELKKLENSLSMENLNLNNLIINVHKKNNIFETFKNHELAGFFSNPFPKNNEDSLSFMLNSLSVVETSRSIYQEYLGIIPEIYNRKVCISPKYLTNSSVIKSEIRVGYKEIISVQIKFNKKLSAVTFVEVKAEDILKPITIILQVNLNIKENTTEDDNRSAKIYISLNNKYDYFTISFEQLDESNFKVKEIITHGKSSIESVATG